MIDNENIAGISHELVSIDEHGNANFLTTITMKGTIEYITVDLDFSCDGEDMMPIMPIEEGTEQ